MNYINIESKKHKEIIDITDIINEILNKQNKDSGLVHIFALHTTCALTTADLDPGTDLDYLDTLEKIVPKLNFRHPHNPNHFPDHFLSSLIGTSLLIPFENKNLLLGTWQRVVLIELDGPRIRNLKINII